MAQLPTSETEKCKRSFRDYSGSISELYWCWNLLLNNKNSKTAKTPSQLNDLKLTISFHQNLVHWNEKEKGDK